MELLDTYNSLKGLPSTHAYNVKIFSQRENVYIGVDAKNRACIFIKTESPYKSAMIKTEKLLISFSIKYQLIIDGIMNKEGLFHSIFCLSNSHEDNATMLNVMESILQDSAVKLTPESLESIFYSLLSLFKVSPSSDLNSERQGLWAELFFMKTSGGFKSWASKWHSDPFRLYDFSMDNRKIEVKSTTRQERIHTFYHRQVFPQSSEDVTIASLLLREDDAGLSLKDLISEARQNLNGTQDYIKLEKAIIRAGMTELNETGPRYIESEAGQELAWFRVSDVPRFQSEEPIGVSGTHYKSDLSTTRRMTGDEIQRWLTPETSM